MKDMHTIENKIRDKVRRFIKGFTLKMTLKFYLDALNLKNALVIVLQYYM